MGNSCGNEGKVDVSTDEQKPDSFVYVKPDAITDVMGIEVEREHANYIYASFCITRLVDKYRAHMFPEITMSVGSFREDIRDYMAVVNEVYHDLCFEERNLPSRHNVDYVSDKQAKLALAVLAFQYYSLSCDKEGRQGSSTEFIKLKSSFLERDNEIISRKDYENCYEDTLKMLVRDLERKEIWQLSTVYSNKGFQELLKEIEPETWEELADDSFEIKVPVKTQMKLS